MLAFFVGVLLLPRAGGVSVGAMAAEADVHAPISVALVDRLVFGKQIISPGACWISLFIPDLDGHFLLHT